MILISYLDQSLTGTILEFFLEEGGQVMVGCLGEGQQIHRFIKLECLLYCIATNVTLLSGFKPHGAFEVLLVFTCFSLTSQRPDSLCSSVGWNYHR